MFLIISHFLIVTILITVLTNTFAAVAANSVEGMHSHLDVRKS